MFHVATEHNTSNRDWDTFMFENVSDENVVAAKSPKKNLDLTRYFKLPDSTPTS